MRVKKYLYTCMLSALALTSQPAFSNEKSGALADTPEELVRIISDAAFVTPDEYRLRKAAAAENEAFRLEQQALPQTIDEATDPYNEILASDLQQYTDEVVSFARMSKDSGELLWGRVQGTEWERMSLDWAEEKLKSFGYQNVHHDKFPSGQEQWRPTKNEVKVVSAPAIDGFEPYEFKSALTAFESKNTPESGIEAEVVYVGDGTASELQGRDLEGKVVLLRARVHPSALMNTARVAFARISTGQWGNPAGVVVWFDIPNAESIAGRVGAPGGGDSIGGVMPWTGINYEDGVYLRKLIDRAEDDKPVTVSLNVQGHMEAPEDRMTGNVYAMLPGNSGQYIVIISHMDSYFYGALDNGTAIAKNLALAKHFINQPQEEREHGIVFMFHGDHEVPGVGGTREFVKQWKQEIDDRLLAVIRSEHLGFKAPMNEGIIQSGSNATMPLMLTVTNQSPAILDIVERAQQAYNLPGGDLAVAAPSIDELAFYPPYYYPPKDKESPITFGWVQTGLQYHTPEDVDSDMISYGAIQNYTRAHAFMINELFKLTEEDLRRDDVPLDTSKNIYQGDLTILTLGDW